MSSFRQFDAFAAARGEGLHPKLRSLLERTAVSPQAEVTIRHDGMLQAGPDPASEADLRDNVRPALLHKFRKTSR
jgi:hypothetical protein